MRRPNPIFPCAVFLIFLSAVLSAETPASDLMISEDEVFGFSAGTASFDEETVSVTPVLPASEPAVEGLPWRFSWSVNFEGTLKFTDNKVGFNPLFRYNDKMLNRNTLRMNMTLLPSDLYTAVVYTYLNVHLRNIYDAENPDEGDFLYRNRYGIGLDNRFSFSNGLDFLVGAEYRLDQSNWNSFKHRLALRALLEGGGFPGFSWAIEQRALPFFTVKAAGLSSFETETMFSAEYDFFLAGSHPSTDGYKLILYNDFYFDSTSFPDGSDTEYYLEETIGVKAGIKDLVTLTFGPTYFFHNLQPYNNVSLFGFKAGTAVAFKTKPITVDGETLQAAKTYTLSAFYWGARNFDRETWDHLLQVSFGISYPGVTQRMAGRQSVVK